jgi:hypothetical protein
MNMSNATKYAARDSATSALRKIGIVKADYDDFIIKRDGVFYCDIEGAKSFVYKQAEKAVANMTLTQVPAPKLKAQVQADGSVKVAPVAKPKTEKGQSVSALIREMILDGFTNQQVWDTLGPKGAGTLGENQKHYGSWYRCELRRKGHAV